VTVQAVSIEPAAITAIVLCGGRGSRMGGRDKPLLEYRDRPIVAHVVDALTGSVVSVLISANRNEQRYRRYGTVVADELTDHGPLSGIASCLKHCTTPYAFVCPGDAPHLDPIVIQRLGHELISSDAMAAAARDDDQRQNLHVLVRANLSSDIDAYLASGARSVTSWLDRIGAVDVDCSDIAESFVDFDDPEDFE
jgi:molybdopterin-guanine dinucleotide biosynthesis protein A